MHAWNIEKNDLFDLHDFAIITVKGQNASGFLQGQMTCDLREVTESAMRQGAFCNLKGRLLTLADVVYCHDYHLVLPENLAEITMSALEKTACVSRVTLKRETDYRVLGLHRNDAQNLTEEFSLPDELFSVFKNEIFCCYYTGENDYIILTNNAYADSLIQSFRDKKKLLTAHDWHLKQIKQSRIRIYPHTRGLFLPHRLGLHLQGYIHFNKGCYKGQEIIARTHFKAKLKHSLSVFRIEPATEPLAGKRILNAINKTEVGEIVDVIREEDHCLVAASVLTDYSGSAFIEGSPEIFEIPS